ncbi:MAG TPA: type 4a pilus biogenesis protein PilO [Candidatus Saccharimonadales bacterium]|nr:type 4a pilus biogenesis protein PilO [Candidatus Saccharimonadales bacterium]
MNIKNKITLSEVIKDKNYLRTLLPKEKRTREFTTLIFTLIALALFGIFAISPTISTILSLQKQRDDSEFVLAQLQQKIKNISSLQKNYALIQTDVPVILSAIPQTPGAPLLLAQIQSVAQSTSVKLTNLQVFAVELTPLSAAGKAPSFTFSMTAQGPQQNLTQFLTALSDMQRILTFDVLAINSTTGQNEQSSLTIRGSAYFVN